MRNLIATAFIVLTLVGASGPSSVAAQQRPRSANTGNSPSNTGTTDRRTFEVESYTLDVTLIPGEHHVEAVAEIVIRQLDRTSVAAFDLDGHFDVSGVTIANNGVKYRQFQSDSTLEVDLSQAPFGETTTVRIEYDGILDPGDDSGAPTLNRLSSDGAFLLYEGKWFPTNGLYADKAEMKLHVKVPAGWTVVSDLPATTAGGTPSHFASKEPGYWGMIAAGHYISSNVKVDGREVTLQTIKAESAPAHAVAEATSRILSFYEQTFGPMPVPQFRIVEIQGANWTSSWSAGTLLLPTSQFRSDFDLPALARTLAHQWFPLKFAVKDPTRDAWLQDGMAVFASLLYCERALSPAETQEQVDKALVKALGFEGATSVRQAGGLDKGSAEYHALVEYKGAFILRMLRWVIGPEKFGKLLASYVERFQKTPASTEALTQLASEVAGEDMGYFFDQWLNAGGVPEMQEDWVVSRVKDGYEITGTIKQDLDLFRMPVEIEFVTDGDSEFKRVEVSGASSNFDVITQRKPKEILIDPKKKILRMSDDIRVAVFINRGEEASNEGRHNDAIDDYQKAIDIEMKNSLALFRMAESWFELGNLQTASDVFKQALQGNLKPKWVEVWAYINLGKIQDMRSNRERAVQEYQKAVNTGDDSYGAQAEAQKYLDKPFRRSGNTIGE